MASSNHHLIEKKVKSLCLHQGSAVSFFKDTVKLPSGQKATREYMLHPGAVCIVPFTTQKKVLILKQYRYPVRETIYEFPAGKLDPKETPLSCARRELAEETGYHPHRLKRIISFWPTPAFATEIMDIYLAWDLEFRAVHRDPDETLDVLKVDFSEVLNWIQVGKIKDAKSIIAALTIQTFNLKPNL